MVEGNRSTGCFGGISQSNIILSSQNLAPAAQPRNRTDSANPEGFQFSFNEISKEEYKGSRDPSPSPVHEFSSRSVPITEELSSLQSQIQAINLKISQNLSILKEKQAKNIELKKLLKKHDIKSTGPTDSSFIENKCSCSSDCQLL